MSLAYISSSTSPSGSWIPLLNTSLGSSAGHSQGPHKIDFTLGWGNENCPTRQWYRDQPTTTFKCLQYREDSRGTSFFHEFIVAELDNGTFCRFDRGGVKDARGEAILGKGIEAEDTAHVLSRADHQFKELEQTSKLLLKVHFPQGRDLITILATCHGIQVDERAGRYTLTRFNCYFFSWTILITAARHTVDWSVVSREPKLWDGLVESSVGRLGLRCDKSKTEAGSVLQRIMKTNEPADDLPPYVGTAYLVETLRRSLIAMRSEIGNTLDELVLQSTVGETMQLLSRERLGAAACEAAKKHAYHAARDAALEAIPEVMWQQVFSNPDAGEEWEATSRETERRVRDAAEAAAGIDLGDGLEGNGWEDAWDMIWGREDASGLISTRAKGAWKDGWTKVCVVNETCLRRICSSVAKYAEDNVPESSQDVLKVEKHDIFGLRPTEMTNKSLQKYLQGRIRDHCKRIGNPQAAAKIEEAMHRVWKSSIIDA
ncbi:hypothetical protein FS749_012954 [Ceratobasidium sp. UAMH 11750]|nr:hypothetical protein FS749_012954 [Ceratobasidium sp. UAMH 11750]